MSEAKSPTQAGAPIRRGVRAAGGGDGGSRPGRGARRPSHIPFSGWLQVLRRTLRDVASDRGSLIASGCAFWATLSLFPAISMLVSLYGLVFNPDSVEPQLDNIRRLLPAPAFTLIAERVRTLVSHPGATLGASLVISTAVTLWSASTGTKSLLSALNLAYEEQEQRGFLKFQAVGLVMTLGAILGAILGLAILVLLPAVISFLGLSAYTKGLVRFGAFAVLLAFVLLALSLLYRFGPSRRMARWHWVTPGSLVATVLWLIASILFSFYVQHVASFDVTYGPLGAVAGIMMWFWVTAYVVLLGAELNAELELQTEEDTTEGGPRPMGQRGAFVADHVAEE
jgi:membrane protein